jgi:hypothetical protein
LGQAHLLAFDGQRSQDVLLEFRTAIDLLGE